MDSVAVRAIPLPSSDTAVPFSDSSLADFAFSAVRLTVAVLSSIVEAISSSAEACSEVRWERSMFPSVIWFTAEKTCSASLRIVVRVLSTLSMAEFMECMSMPNSSPLPSSFSRAVTSRCRIFSAKSSMAFMGALKLTVEPMPAAIRTIIVSITADMERIMLILLSLTIAL